MKILLDLCAGLGGFSQAFKERVDWQVVTVDFNPKFNTTMILDLVDAVENPDKYPEFWNLNPDVILASPPCERFSLAVNSFPKLGIYQAMRVAGACLEIITKMNPKGWILENPKARLRWFLGVPNKTVNLSHFGYRTVKPTDFWTNIDIDVPQFVRERNPEGISFNQVKSASARAKMPYALSEHILDKSDEMLKEIK